MVNNNLDKKICNNCDIEKNIDQFHKDPNNKKDGLRNECKDCRNGKNSKKKVIRIIRKEPEKNINENSNIQKTQSEKNEEIDQQINASYKSIFTKQLYQFNEISQKILLLQSTDNLLILNKQLEEIYKNISNTTSNMVKKKLTEEETKFINSEISNETITNNEIISLENIKYDNNMESQYIYLLIEREFIKTNENIFKLGKTKQSNLKRFDSYPKGSKLLYQTICSDCDSIEILLIKIFKKTYKQRKDIGNEYFEGNYKHMIDIIYENTI